MTEPISADVKKRVVQQHIAGLGRNMIAKRTGLSRGSVTNILKAWREQSGRPEIVSPEPVAAIPDTPHEIAQVASFT